MSNLAAIWMYGIVLGLFIFYPDYRWLAAGAWVGTLLLDMLCRTIRNATERKAPQAFEEFD